MAKDLCNLLDAAEVPGLHVVVYHSYGGLIAREFLALKEKDVVKAVFVDTNTSKEIHLPSRATS
jgi:pimeloyl-ACP methyl ester carboxylesterase